MSSKNRNGNSLPVIQNDLAAWAEVVPDSIRRRSFLKAVGFGVAGIAGLSTIGCQRTPERKAVTLLNQPEGIIPGRTIHLATCNPETGSPMLATCRDGRPIKLEGNPEHPVSRGGLSAIDQAALLGLYDKLRFPGPLSSGKETAWSEVDREVMDVLKDIRGKKQAVRFLTSTIRSRIQQNAIDGFLKSFADGKQVVFESLSDSPIADAFQKTHGVRGLPQFHFDRAKVIVGFDADFLGTWIAPAVFTKQWASGRDVEGKDPVMSYHAQFEPHRTLTGDNADDRHALAPAEFAAAIGFLAQQIAKLTKREFSVKISAVPDRLKETLEDLAQRLYEHKGASLVVCGVRDVQLQQVCNFINHALENFGTTIVAPTGSDLPVANDAEVEVFIDEMKQGKISAVFIHESNPVFDLPASSGIVDALKQVDQVIQLGTRPNDTTALASFVCPTPHYLESWLDDDSSPKVKTLVQPTCPPLFNGRSLVESLSTWTGSPVTDREALEEYLKTELYPRSGWTGSFQAFRHQALKDGFVVTKSSVDRPGSFQSIGLTELKRHVDGDGFTLVGYPKVGIGDGRHSYNPWLQELPDPVTKVTWDNYACLSVATARELGLVEGDLVEIKSRDGTTVELPVYVLPGIDAKVIAVAIGYGSVMTERFAGIGPQWLEARRTINDDGRIGKKITDLFASGTGPNPLWASGVRVAKTGRKHPLACTQTYHRITVPKDLAPEGGQRRPIIHETTFEEFREDPHSGHHEGHSFGPNQLYGNEHPKEGHRWRMAIDLTKCTGCSACVIACQAENNIPVVGKDEVRRRRDMHWMRIDRYFSNEGDDVQVSHQPMLCQHCENASCENVCPVLATVHTHEGLNAQVYNRCVGTRYCANNCAYKVRRFNWFDYARDDELANMALNPNVTVRSRGIMEKCSFCIQRIQEAKLEARRLGKPLGDDMLQTACQQSCPADAIVFGDANNPESRISRLLKENPRAYRVLEEVGVEPSVHYLTSITNRSGAGHASEDKGANHHG